MSKIDEKEKIANHKDERKGASSEDGSVRFTAPPESVEMDSHYDEFIKALVQDVHKTRISVVLASNSSMVLLYWNIGNAIYWLFGQLCSFGRYQQFCSIARH